VRVELCVIFEIKMATGGHLEFLRQVGKISNHMYWTVFVPRNLLFIGEKMRSLSATVAEIRPIATFGACPLISPILGVRGNG